MSKQKSSNSSEPSLVTADYRRKDKAHFIHPYTDFATFQQEGSHVISRGSGCYVTDSDGKQYLDAIAGLWCANIGHGRSDMADAIAAQVRKIQYFNPFISCL